MKRSTAVSRALLAGAMAIGGWLAITAAPAGAGAARPTSSACVTITLTHFSFTPPSVGPGGSSKAVLTAHNCTGSAQDASVTWSGRFDGPGGAIPPGCPVIDPLARPIHLGPHRNVRSSVSYEVPDTCTATSLKVTDTLRSGGKVLAKKSATLTIT